MRISEIFTIDTPEALMAARNHFEEKLHETLTPLVKELESNILSTDVASIEAHMALVESWRSRLVKYHAFASAFCDHAKDSTFLQDKTTDGDKPVKITEIERDAYRRKLSSGFAALQTLLEGYIDSVDSRVNLAKKVLGIEVIGSVGKKGV